MYCFVVGYHASPFLFGHRNSVTIRELNRNTETNRFSIPRWAPLVLRYLSSMTDPVPSQCNSSGLWPCRGGGGLKHSLKPAAPSLHAARVTVATSPLPPPPPPPPPQPSSSTLPLSSHPPPTSLLAGKIERPDARGPHVDSRVSSWNTL